MDKLSIIGGNPLHGEITVSGMKNSALPVIFACILVDGECVIENIPRVSDVENSLNILKVMGAKAEFVDKNVVLIDCRAINNDISGYDEISKMRASSYLMGSMLARFGYAKLPMPGGCNFGARPIEQHIKGFTLMGACCKEEDGIIDIYAPKGLKSEKILLDKISVGATINMVLASVLTDGITVIENPAKEPHVDDLICFLNSCGAKIARKDGKIYCVGVKKLSGIRYKIFPDMIETLTYMVILGVCGGKIYLKCVNYEHIRYVCNLLEKMGYNLTVYNDFISAEVNDVLNGVSVKTAPYPFFPTDLHPQLSSLLCFTKNGGIIEEGIYPTRFQYVDELKKMGANIIHENGSVCVRPSRLYGAELVAPDLRAGAALICGALGAQGQSTIENVNYIVRGYENLVDKISSINGKIKLIKGE